MAARATAAIVGTSDCCLTCFFLGAEMTSPTANPASPEPPAEQPGDQPGTPTDATITTQTDDPAEAVDVEPSAARSDERPDNVVAMPLAGVSGAPATLAVEALPVPAVIAAPPAAVVAARPPTGHAPPAPVGGDAEAPAGGVVAALVGAVPAPTDDADDGAAISAPADDGLSLRDLFAKVVPMVPGLMIVVGLVAVFLAYGPETPAFQEYRELFLTFAVLAPIMLILGFYLQARQILADAFTQINRILSDVNNARSDALEAKLESLDTGLSLCRFATSKSRPILLLAVALLAYGAPLTALGTSGLMSVLLPGTGSPDPLMAILLFRAPPIAFLTGFVLIVWYAYQAARLKEFHQYIVDERGVVIGKKRILDRFASRYVELASLTEQVSELIKVNEKLATSDAGKNSTLLLLGVFLSALISIVGILGSADLLAIGGVPLNGNVVSAILGVVVAAIITVQNTFRLAERSRFQRQVASDGRKLFMELVFSVDDNEKLQAVVKDYQRLSDRSVRDFPTARELEAPVESSRSQRESSTRGT